MQRTGRFRRWWQVLGSNQRRLSRRFYSVHAVTIKYASDLRKCPVVVSCVLLLSAIRPWAPSSSRRNSANRRGRRPWARSRGPVLRITADSSHCAHQVPPEVRVRARIDPSCTSRIPGEYLLWTRPCTPPNGHPG